MKVSLFLLTCSILGHYKGDASFKSITSYYDTKTSCFGLKGMALYYERKAFNDTKTTCFGTHRMGHA